MAWHICTYQCDTAVIKVKVTSSEGQYITNYIGRWCRYLWYNNVRFVISALYVNKIYYLTQIKYFFKGALTDIENVLLIFLFLKMLMNRNIQQYRHQCQCNLFNREMIIAHDFLRRCLPIYSCTYKVEQNTYRPLDKETVRSVSKTYLCYPGYKHIAGVFINLRN